MSGPGPRSTCPCRCHRTVVEVDGTRYAVMTLTEPAYLDTVAALQACHVCDVMHEHYRRLAGHRVIPEPSPRR